MLARRMQIAIVATAALAGAVCYGIVWATSGQSAPQPDRAASAPAHNTGGFRPTKDELAGLKIEPIATRVFLPEKRADGYIAVDDDLSTPVFSPYSGRVVRLVAKLGDYVSAGAPLFAVEATEFVQASNALISAVAAFKTAHSQLAQGQINEKRAHELYLAKGGALKDWQQSRTDLAFAENTLRSADTALAAARNQLRILGKSEAEIAALEAQPTQKLEPLAIVAAPRSGTVTQRQVGLGQYIQSVSSGAASPVFTIGDLSTVWLIADVRESDAAAIRLGEPVEVRVLAYPGRVFRARISYIAPAVDPNTHRLPVRTDVENPDGTLKPMMFARFAIITGPAVASPAVPQSAVVYEGDEARVWIAAADGTLALRHILPGETIDGVVQVLSGLAAGEKVVTGGTLFIDRAARSD